MVDEFTLTPREGAVMFAPLTTKAQAKAAADSIRKRMGQHSPYSALPFDGDEAAQVNTFQERSDHFATPERQVEARVGAAPEDVMAREQEEARGVSWNFSNISLLPPDWASHPHTFTATNTGAAMVSRAARNPDESSPVVEREGSLIAALVESHASAMKEQKAPANTAMQVTTQFAGSHPTFINLGFACMCQAPRFGLAGQISVPPARADGDLTVGFMQALIGSTGPIGHYYDANGAPYQTAYQPYADSLPVRDAETQGGFELFYGPEARHDVDAPTVSVSMADQPQQGFHWTTPDERGKLEQITGEQRFVTWLVTKSDSTGEIKPLRHISWSIDWFAAVDESEQSGTSFGVGTITDFGGGEGPLAPIRSGPVANQSGQQDYHWEPEK